LYIKGKPKKVIVLMPFDGENQTYHIVDESELPGWDSSFEFYNDEKKAYIIYPAKIIEVSNNRKLSKRQIKTL
jgi:hypothetical protein